MIRSDARAVADAILSKVRQGETYLLTSIPVHEPGECGHCDGMRLAIEEARREGLVPPKRRRK